MNIEAYLWTRKNVAGKYPIKIRITINRKSIYKNIDYAIHKRHWNKNTHKVRESYDNCAYVNNLIESTITDLKIEYRMNDFSLNVKPSSYIEFFKYHMGILQKSKRIGDYKKYNSAYNHLLIFLEQEYKRKDIGFNEIDKYFLDNLKAYFDGKGLSHITQNGYFKKIKNVYRQAIKNNAFSPIRDPFIDFKNPTAKAKNKSLTLEEITSIEVFNPFQYYFKKQSVHVAVKDLFDAKNCFLFQFYLRGIRVSDLLYLKWKNINNGRLDYIMYKTGKAISIPLNEKLLYILRLYLPVNLKLAYIKMNNYADKEMFYSLSSEYQDKIKERLKNKNYYDNFINYSYNYEVKSYQKIIQLVNHASTNIEYKEQYIFNLLSPKQIRRLEEATTDDYKDVMYRTTSSATALYNKKLKLINKFIFDNNGQKITTNITSHLSRHTYSSVAVKLGFDINTISKSLGHSDLKTTQAYLKTLDTDFVDSENERLFNKLNDTVNRHIEQTKNLYIANTNKIKPV